MTIEFKEIVRSIVDVHQELHAQASRAVNLSLTLRNWMIGYYIDAFELQGADRADYGDQLFAKLSLELTAAKLSNCDKRQLYRYLRLFRCYPQIVGTLSPKFGLNLFLYHSRLILGTVSPKFGLKKYQYEIRLSLTAGLSLNPK